MLIEAPSDHPAQTARERAEPVTVTTIPPSRRYELDWLRILIVMGAIALHAVYEMQARFPRAQSDSLTQMGSAFAIQWGLPSLFLVAGASAWLSLASRTPQQFIRERVLHLLVPFIGCMLTIIPLTGYITSLTTSGPRLSLWRFYGEYLQRYTQILSGNPLDQLVSLWGVLWFILVIFLVSLVTLPLMLALREPRATPVVTGFARICRIPGGTLVVAPLFVAVSWLSGVVAPTSGVRSLWLVILYVLCYIAGGLLYADPAIERAVARDSFAALALAICCFLIDQFLAPGAGSALSSPGSSLLFAALAGCFPWFGVVAFLGVSKRLFDFSNPATEYLREVVFPYFLLHMLVLSLMSYVILEHSRMWGILQAVTIIACSAASLALVYEGLIRRYGFLRLLFGLKRRPGM